MNSAFQNVKKAYFIGIGGIGVSAIARMFLYEAKEIYGSDISDSDNIEQLRKAGADILIGQSIDHIPHDVDMIVYTIAIEKFAADFLAQVKTKFSTINSDVKIISYPEALSDISKHKYTIAVSGTHGKTTTTAMIAKMLIDAGLDPTVIVGSMLKDQKTNFIAGTSNYLVVEACEYCRSFLNINPTVAVITSIDEDHLDYYKDLNDITSAFKEFVAKVPVGGFIIGDTTNNVIAEVMDSASHDHSLQEINPEKINAHDFFDSKLKLMVPGEHNRKNASLALAVADTLGIKPDVAKKSLETFAGTWRRFEYKGKTKEGAIVYDDYGHHPAEIKATLQGVKELYPKHRIIAVFEPHLFSRTKMLFKEFSECFTDADQVCVLPIYPAREVFDSTISSEMLVDEIFKHHTSAHFLPSFAEAKKYLARNGDKDTIILCTGAGTITDLATDIVA